MMNERFFSICHELFGLLNVNTTATENQPELQERNLGCMVGVFVFTDVNCTLTDGERERG